MASGELQAGFTGPAGIGRAGPPTGNWEEGGQTAAQVYPELIPDVANVEADWYRRTGIYPIHGTIVVKDEVLKKHPFVARSLLDAFTAAKQPYLERLKAGQGSAPEDVRYRSLRTADERSPALRHESQQGEHRGAGDLRRAAGTDPEAAGAGRGVRRPRSDVKARMWQPVRAYFGYPIIVIARL